MGRAAPTCIRKVTGVRNAPRCNVGAATEAHTLHRQTLQFAERDVMEYLAVARGSLRLDVGRLDHLGPLVDLVGNEFSEFGGCQ